MNARSHPGVTRSPLPILAMHARIRSIVAALAVATPVGLQARIAAGADQEVGPGRVIRVTINAVGSDKYASFHGAVTIQRSGNKEVYYWGGSTCPAQKFSDEQVELLTKAFYNRKATLVIPRFVEGQGMGGGARCLVAFELVAG